MIINEADKGHYQDVWILAEVLFGKVEPVTYELLGAARRLADARGAKVCALLIGKGVSGQAGGLFEYGADTVRVVDAPELYGFNDELECRVADRLIRKHKPEILLGAATARGRALIPRIAVRSVSGLTADCIQLDIDGDNGDLLQTRPAFGGNIMATIRTSKHRPQMATVRPRVMQPLPREPGRSGTLIQESLEPGETENIKRVLELVYSEETNTNLGEAAIIVSGGRAMKGPGGFDMLRELAAKLGGAVGASRAAIDAGWMPYAYQIGQTGQTVQSKLYIACGISGQIQHLVGMQSCETIVAIDKKPDTPLMQMADIAVVGDVFQVVPELIRAL
ncbi:MAG: electron transfer flavoprotein subunit alpha/FixB family protein [Treponema sp.]|jgi:electron transfer flavoprotein alpha subunit|nr:electron transfer flavoprotein subunit alpha/FixB family protein [Treponema sp.]